MKFKVVAKRYGDAVEFLMDAETTKDALRSAKQEANDIFSYNTGDAGAPTVSVKPIFEEEE